MQTFEEKNIFWIDESFHRVGHVFNTLCFIQFRANNSELPFPPDENLCSLKLFWGIRN
jgi:hypothetical protein